MLARSMVSMFDGPDPPMPSGVQRKSADRVEDGFVKISASASQAVSTAPRADNQAPAASADVPEDASSVSGPAKFLSDLEALKSSDPAAFTKTLNDLAQKVSDDANASTGAGENARLTDFAAKLSDAAKSGDVSSLPPPDGPPPPPPPQRAPPPAKGDAAAGAKKDPTTTAIDSTKVYEAADTNRDGKVSLKEAAVYAAKMAAQAYAKISQSA